MNPTIEQVKGKIMSKDVQYTDDFLQFWKQYPARYNVDSHKSYKVGKWEAQQEWNKLSDNDKTEISIKVKYVQTGQFVLDAFRWLKKRRWDDIELPKSKESILPPELTANVLKTLPPKESRNTARNRNMDSLKSESERIKNVKIEKFSRKDLLRYDPIGRSCADSSG